MANPSTDPTLFQRLRRGVAITALALLLPVVSGPVLAQCGSIMHLGGMMVSAGYHINIPNTRDFAFQIVAMNARCTINASNTASASIGTDTDICHNWSATARPFVGVDQSMSFLGGGTGLGSSPNCSVHFFDTRNCTGTPVTTCVSTAVDGLPVELMSFSVEPDEGEPEAEEPESD